MADGSRPRFARSYPANVVLTVLTLFPGLINTSAIALLSPVIGGDLGVAPDAAAALPLISDAALAFGCVVAAELTRRVEGRAIYFWLLGVSLATSLASALAPSFAVLLFAHVVHGLAAGMLFVVSLPPLLTTFGGAKLRATATVLVPSLFGAGTLGPVIGALLATPQTWRVIFAIEVVVAVAAFALGRLTLAPREPQGRAEPVDWYALLTAGVGSLLVYAGVGGLAGNSWRDPRASGPVAGGVLAYVALLIGEAREPHPLVPVRRLATSLGLIGAVATVVGSAAFSALTQCFILTLLRVDGLTARATGLAFWPEFLAALASGYLFGRLVATRWVLACGPAGLACIIAAAALARAIAPVTATEVSALCFVASFGAGLSVTPGLIIVALSFERALVARAIALLNLFRLTLGFISAPGVEHTIGSRATAHLVALDPSLPAAVAEPAIRHFLTGAAHPDRPFLEVLRQALALGIDDAYLVVLAIALGGVVAIVAIVLTKHVRLCAPNLGRFDRGEPALQPGS